MKGKFERTKAYTVGVGRQEDVSLVAIEEALSAFRAQMEWCLISPDGRVWKGTNPMELAAVATYKPPSMADIKL